MLLRDYLRLTGMTMTYTFAVCLVLPVLAPYFHSRGFSDAQVSLVFALFPLVGVCTSLLVPLVARKFGRYFTMLVALLFGIVAYWLYVVGSPLSIVVARIIDAAVYVFLSVLLLSKLEDKLDSQERGRYSGVTFSLEYIAKLLAPLLGGILADRALALPFVGSIVLFAVLGFSLRNVRAHEHEASGGSVLSSVRWFAGQPKLRALLFLGPAMNASAAAFIVYLPLLVVHEYALNYAAIGVALAVFGAAHVLQFFFGDLSDRYGRHGFLLMGCTLYGAMLVVLGLAHYEYKSLLLVLGIAGVGAALWNIVAWSYMADVAATEHKQTDLVAAYVSIAKLGDAAGLLLGAALVGFLGYRGMFVLLGVVALCGVMAAAIIFSSQRSLKVEHRSLVQRSQ